MKYLYSLIFIATISCGVSENRHRSGPSIEVNFSPNGDAEKSIIREIDNARLNIRIQAYSFTSKPIGEALLAANHRGVVVEALLDGENLGNPHSLLVPLARAGVKCYLDRSHAIAHNKIMVIDDDTVITGSFNFTKAAQEKNSENSLIIKDQIIRDKYLSNWKLHRAHSIAYIPTE